MNEFSKKITQLIPTFKLELEKLIGCDLIYEQPTDYSMSESLRFWMDKNAKCLQKGKGDFEIRIYFSWRAPLFSIFTLDAKQHSVPYGHLLPLKLLPQEVIDILVEIRKFLEKFDLKELAEDQFQVLSDGETTELDGQPATLFEAYFAELI